MFCWAFCQETCVTKELLKGLAVIKVHRGCILVGYPDLVLHHRSCAIHSSMGPMPRAHCRLPGRVSLSGASAHRTQMSTEHVLFIRV